MRVHYVNEPNTFDLVVNATTDITCLNDTNGTATITFVDRLITTTPTNGDDAGAFTYTRFVSTFQVELLPMLDLPATTGFSSRNLHYNC
jgi:hypothetical protein